MSTHELHEIRAIADDALAATSDAATAIVTARRAASLDVLTALTVE